MSRYTDTELLDAHNHIIDAIRYGAAPLIRRNQRRVGVYFPGME